MIWHDGAVIPDGELRVGIDDRVFEHGLGLFETFRSWVGRAPLLSGHLERLRASARELGIELEGVRLPDRRAVASLLEVEGLGGDAMFRLTVTAGSEAGRPPLAWMTARPLPPPEPVPLRLTTRVGPSFDSSVHRHKMLNYWGRRLAYESARESGADEALLTSPEGHVWEGSRNNILVIAAGPSRAIATPDLRGPVLPGVMRKVALDFAASRGYEIGERTLNLRELFDAKAVFLTNSVRGVRLVGRVDGHPIGLGPCADLARLFGEVLHRSILAMPDLVESNP